MRLSQIVRMVSAAQRSHAPIQRVADEVAGWFVPAVIAVAGISFIAWMMWGPSPAVSHALIAAVSVLIIACPCALGLATPMSIMVGIGRGAQSGVLIRNADALERTEKVDTLVVDKTGTLTEGHPKVVRIEVTTGFDADGVLQKLASVEKSSEHPLASAIVAEALARRLNLSPATDFDSPVGQGVVGTVAGARVICGSARFLTEKGVDVASLVAAAEALSAKAATVVFVAIEPISTFVAPLSSIERPTTGAIRDGPTRPRGPPSFV